VARRGAYRCYLMPLFTEVKCVEGLFSEVGCCAGVLVCFVPWSTYIHLSQEYAAFVTWPDEAA
jgi:hypothetical protein